MVGGPLAPTGGPWAPAREGGGIYSTRGGGGGWGKVMRSPGKKILLYAGYFLLLFCMWGPFCYVFFFIRVARALTPVQMFVGGGGGGVGKPKKDQHKKAPPHTIKKVAKKAPTWRKSR